MTSNAMNKPTSIGPRNRFDWWRWRLSAFAGVVWRRKGWGWRFSWKWSLWFADYWAYEQRLIDDDDPHGLTP